MASGDSSQVEQHVSSEVLVREIYPAVSQPSAGIFVVVSVFLLCFIVGVCGTSSTATSIYGCGKPAFKRLNLCKKGSNTKLFVSTLCFIDTIMLLSLPSAIADNLIGFWIFGSTACKIHQLFGSIGRITSSIMIAAMAIDWYFVIAFEDRSRVASKRTTMLIIACLFLTAVFILMPIMIYADAQEMPILTSNRSDGSVLRVRIYKCVDVMPTNLLFWFTGVTFVVGYFIPLLIVAVLSASFSQIYRQNVLLLNEATQWTRRVTGYMITIATCYFLCWTPYWLSVIYVSYVDLVESRTIQALKDSTETAMMLLYGAHLLPYLNASINWIFYGRLVSAMRQRQSDDKLDFLCA
uniref:G_PROTEIN_RECEP_F1_2 domain-containing protein n=1 Tax=Steinernema glaseri TaxID=37863 RepID=A0A1I7YS76_9BILA